jgi:hypothetical protein
MYGNFAGSQRVVRAAGASGLSFEALRLTVELLGIVPFADRDRRIREVPGPDARVGVESSFNRNGERFPQVPDAFASPAGTVVCRSQLAEGLLVQPPGAALMAFCGLTLRGKRPVEKTKPRVADPGVVKRVRVDRVVAQFFEREYAL